VKVQAEKWVGAEREKGLRIARKAIKRKGGGQGLKAPGLVTPKSTPGWPHFPSGNACKVSTKKKDWGEMIQLW